MFEKLKTLVLVLISHRAIYAGLGITYASAVAGADHYIVYGLAAALYALLSLRG